MADIPYEHQFRCSICLDFFTDPVSTPCGHNFCKFCIEKYWDTTEVCSCPLCKEVFSTRPELRINISFRDIVNHFKNTTLCAVTSDETSVAKADDVVCDVCTDVKVKAAKSCLVCIASYCETHLKPHKTAAVLSKHKLIEPSRDLEDRICQKHERILELFCRKEEVFICQTCAETDHRRHQVVTADVATQQKLLQIKRKEREVELMIQDRQKRIEEINHSRKKNDENADQQMEISVKVFMTVMESFRKTHSNLIKEIETRCNAEQKRFEKLTKILKQEIGELEKKSVELQQLSLIEDDISLHQAFNKANTLPAMHDWPNIPVDEVDFLGYIRTSLNNAKEFINLEIKEQAATELKKVQKYAEDITIDPDTAGPWLIVSEDGKEVRQSPKKHKVPVSPARFTENTFVLATQGLTKGRHYWEVGVKEKANWVLGVSSGSLMRTEHITPCPENGMWALSHKDTVQYFALEQNPFPLMLPPPVQRVGVFVDYEERQVTFFNVEAKTHIFTFTECNFTGRVYPIFDPCLATEKKEVAPLRVMIVEVTK
ncbi:E3 ubiquitin-protein ligase TRIM39-like [Mugil cephalus]|uniref:E3 ubiquitin-protein ligase TRIM39-like n=1 Tax=Mugil cephalus TaxID=48193 RepID=UPI001FB64E4B|nr:E3 ubiquitin-protein ligase TRIM39-like [Mugil cephalus]